MYVEHLDLPQIPDEVIKELLEANPDTGNYSYKFEPEFEDVALFTIYNVDLSQLKTTWFKDNNQDQYGWIIQKLQKGAYLVPHRDDHRDYTIMYVIETGGENVQTCFYKQLLDKEYPPTKAIPREELELAHSEVFDQNRWYKLNVQIPHSVENLESTRLCLVRQIPEHIVDYGAKWGITHK